MRPHSIILRDAREERALLRMRPVCAAAWWPHRRGGVSFTFPFGRGRREAPGEGFRSIDGAQPLTRIARAIRPLPMGEVKLNATPFLISKRSITPRRGDSVHAVVATALRNDGLKRRIQISNSERICVRILAARCARGLHQLHPPSEERAQGKPDADRTRGRAHKKRTSGPQVQPDHSGFPCANGLRLTSCSPR